MGRARGAVRVPGVKLRPANPNAAQSKGNVIESDDDDETLDSKLVETGRDVFRGIVVCATGIKNKREIFKIVKAMGGTHSTDFTDLTTHLIAEETGSEKYTCAIVRDVPVVTTSWIEEAHDRWIHGDVFSPRETVDSHRLLPFTGMKICITGIETADIRARIHNLAKRYGGEYLKNLDKTCTHLLCATEASGKIEWANKNNAEREVMRARADGKYVPPAIHLLWEEWFWDCVYRKGLLPYDSYHITKPRPEPLSRSVMNSPEVFVKPLPVATRGELPPALPLAGLLIDTGDSALPVKRRKSAAGKQWDSIIKRHAVTGSNRSTQDGCVDSIRMSVDSESYPSETTSPMKKAWCTSTAATPATTGWSRRSAVKKGAATSESSGTSGTKKILAVKLPPDSVEPQLSQSSFLGKFKRTTAFDEMVKPKDNAVASALEPTPHSRIFSGLNFIALGDAACEAVTGALEQAGARVLTSGSPNYYIVRLNEGAKFMPEWPKEEHSKFRTECWLERCLFEKRVCSLEENVTYAPLLISSPPEGASKFLVAFSGLDSFERTWVSRLLRSLGIKLSLNFSPQCTHLLCPSGEGIKCVKAKEWNIPIVGFDWVLEITRAAALQTSQDTRTPTTPMNEGDDGDLKVEQSMEAMQLEKNGKNLSPSKEGTIFSPVFKIASRNPIVVDERPPSPVSPSPQRNRTLPHAASNMVTPSKSSNVNASKSPSSKSHPTPQTNDEPSVHPPQKGPSPTTTAEKSAQGPSNSSGTQRVPSSATPSPLATRFGGSASAVKGSAVFGPLHLQSASAQALSRNIGAILGSKRAAENDTDGGTSSATSGAGRPRKRPRRPQPSRSTNSKGTTLRKLGSVPPMNLYENDEESQQSVAMESPTEPVGGIAVNYSDPSEAEERRRLLMLVNKSEAASTEPVTNGKKAPRLGPRKSARQAGNHV